MSSADYSVTCSKICYDQLTHDTQELVYEMVLLNSIEVPKSWHDNRVAGVHWLRDFKK